MKDNNILVSVMAELAVENGLPFPFEIPDEGALRRADCERAELTPPEIMQERYHGGDMVCVGAFSGIPSDGKRLFLLNAALYKSLKDDGECVLYLAPEQSAREILRQWISVLSRVPLRRINGRCLSCPDWKSVCDAYFRLFYMNIRLIAQPGLDADAVEKLLGDEPEIGFVAVDGINQMRENEMDSCGCTSEKYEAVVYALKQLAKQRSLPILCGLTMFLPLPPKPLWEQRPTLSDLQQTMRGWCFEKVILIDGNTLAPMELYAVSVVKDSRGAYSQSTLFADDTGRLVDADELGELFYNDHHDELPYELPF